MPCVCQICQMQFQVLSNYQHPTSHRFEIQTTCHFCQLLTCDAHTSFHLGPKLNSGCWSPSSIPYQKNDTKWPKMKKTLFSFDRLNEKINAKPTLYSETSSWFITDILQNRKCVISFCPNLSSRIQADLFKLKDNLQLPNHVCLWSQSSTLKVDVCPGLVCKLNSGTISKYLALNKFERKIIGNSNFANNVMSLTPRYTAD